MTVHPVEKRILLTLFCLSTLLLPSQKGLDSRQINDLIARSQKRFPQAGLAVTVVKDGRITHLGGYGVTSTRTGERVNEDTLFAIASNSKAFTAAALAILVDEGRLHWEDKVIDHIPEFRMYDPYVTAQFTIVDLLTHRSGLGLGAGDLLHFPDGSDFTVTDILRALPHLKPVSPFRTRYDYDNLLYVVAGEVVARITQSSWEAFVENRIFKPLGMNRSRGSLQRVGSLTNVAQAHSEINGHLQGIPSYTNETTAAAGGIYASARDMGQWLLVQLGRGRYGQNPEQRLFSEAAQNEMWRAHTTISFSVTGSPRYHNHLRAYGLGWEIGDYCGHMVLSHTGGLPGMLSRTILVPDLNLGIAVLTNAHPGGLSYFSISQSILDACLGVPSKDWIETAAQTLSQNKQAADAATEKVWATVRTSHMDPRELSRFVGSYRDPWFGLVEISLKDQELWFRSLRSPKLKGQMFFYRASTFAIRWDYTDMPCDAFAIFQLDSEGNPEAIRMKGISPNIDFSFDFQDLLLERVPPQAGPEPVASGG